MQEDRPVPDNYKINIYGYRIFGIIFTILAIL